MFITAFELHNNKRNKEAHVPREDSDQHRQLPSLIKVFPVFPSLDPYLPFNPFALRMAKTPQSFGHSKCNRVFNPFALRMAKTPQSFGHSKCNRVKCTVKNSDQTGWLPRLIQVFAGCTSTLLVLFSYSSFQVSGMMQLRKNAQLHSENGSSLISGTRS